MTLYTTLYLLNVLVKIANKMGNSKRKIVFLNTGRGMASEILGLYAPTFVYMDPRYWTLNRNIAVIIIIIIIIIL
jgi:hypothetical protein